MHLDWFMTFDSVRLPESIAGEQICKRDLPIKKIDLSISVFTLDLWMALCELWCATLIGFVYTKKSAY
jgi:hypothetical protein